MSDRVPAQPFLLSFRTLNQNSVNGHLLPGAFRVPWRPGGKALGWMLDAHAEAVRTRLQRVGELAGLVVARAAGDEQAATEIPAALAAAYGATGALVGMVQDILGELHEACTVSAVEQERTLAEIRRFVEADGLFDEAIAAMALSELGDALTRGPVT